MREIKFRGKRLDNGEWEYGDLLQYDDGSVCIGVHSKNYTDDGFNVGQYHHIAPVNEDTVGEYTGLKDRNGKEVYEGDIIRFSNPYLIISQGKQSFGMVKYYDALAGFALYNSSEDKFPMECDWLKIDGSTKVFGNIHDNPEFLKGGEQ